VERPFGDKEFTDKGKSAYHADHIASGQFGHFLNALPKPWGNGMVRPGDYLLIEKIDRMSRTPPDEAQEIFLRITNSGVVIVTFENAEPKVYQKPVNIVDLITTVLVMSRANEEIANKTKNFVATLKEKERLYEAGMVKKGGRVLPWLEPIKADVPGMRFKQT